MNEKYAKIKKLQVRSRISPVLWIKTTRSHDNFPGQTADKDIQ